MLVLVVLRVKRGEGEGERGEEREGVNARKHVCVCGRGRGGLQTEPPGAPVIRQYEYRSAQGRGPHKRTLIVVVIP